jgi:hypothetical protein
VAFFPTYKQPALNPGNVSFEKKFENHKFCDKNGLKKYSISVFLTYNQISLKLYQFGSEGRHFHNFKGPDPSTKIMQHQPWLLYAFYWQSIESMYMYHIKTTNV